MNALILLFLYLSLRRSNPSWFTAETKMGKRVRIVVNSGTHFRQPAASKGEEIKLGCLALPRFNSIRQRQ